MCVGVCTGVLNEGLMAGTVFVFVCVFPVHRVTDVDCVCVCTREHVPVCLWWEETGKGNRENEREGNWPERNKEEVKGGRWKK